MGHFWSDIKKKCPIVSAGQGLKTPFLATFRLLYLKSFIFSEYIENTFMTKILSKCPIETKRTSRRSIEVLTEMSECYLKHVT